MATRVRLTTVEEVSLDSAAAASFVIDLINKQQTSFTEGGWSFSELGVKYNEQLTAEVVSDD